MLKRLFRPTNKRVRLLVGLMLAALFCIQCTRTDAFRQSSFVTAISGKVVGNNAPNVLSEVDRLAKSDHIGLLEYCLDKYNGRYGDYTCTFIKQERINGTVGKQQEIFVKFLDSPYSVAMAWTAKTAPIADRVLYVEGKYDGQMLVRPKGFLGVLVGTVARRPDSPEAMRNTLRPVNMFGFERMMKNLLNVYGQARKNGDLKQAFGGYAEVAGRKAVALIRYLPPKDDYQAHKTVIYIDLEYLLPIGEESYDWDDALCYRYFYKDIKFNV